MSDFVLDASVILAPYLPGSIQQKEYAQRVLLLIENGAVPAVPGLCMIEAASVLIRAKRSKAISAASYSKALAEIDMLPYDTHHLLYTASSVATAAQHYHLQGYDAVYFDLAKRLNIPIASNDKGIISACKAHGVKLI